MAQVGLAAVAVVVIGWLVVSFSRPGPRRTLLEWVSACGLYTALLMLFTSLVRRGLVEGSTVAVVAFGFLAVLFGSGLVVCVFQTLRAARGPSGSRSSATN
jgi:hypothetical protein